MPAENVRSQDRKQVSPKQHARIWFEFYKLALDDAALADEVRRSRSFYRPWGEVRGVAFNTWWTEHAYLFETAQVTEVARVSSDPGALHVRVPIGMSATAAGAQVQQLLLEKQKSWSAAHGLEVRRGARVGAAQFRLTPGVKFAGRSADLALRLYRDVYLPEGSPPIGNAFAGAVARYFRENPRIKMTPIYLSQDQEGIFEPDVLRSLRRAISRATALAHAAARGEFPGKERA
jgi:hypothetical protein